jgi:hypothetical protein
MESQSAAAASPSRDCRLIRLGGIDDNAIRLAGPLSGDPSLVHVIEDSLAIAIARIPIATTAAAVSNDCLSRLQDDPATRLELAQCAILPALQLRWASAR